MQMNRAEPWTTLFGRTVAGVFAGGIFGLITQLLLFWDGQPVHRIRLPLLGPVVGGGVFAFLAVAVGGRVLPGWLHRVAIATLGGVVLGACCGAFLYAPLMASLHPDADGVFRGKVEAAYQRVGVVFGVPLGALAGLVAAGVWSLLPGGWRSQAEPRTPADGPTSMSS